MLLPAVTVYLLQKNLGTIHYKYHQAETELLIEYAQMSASFQNRRCFQHFLVKIKRKEAPDDSDEPFYALNI
ncbi:hypothetical protein CWS20_02300 [Cytobacillus horneckiae]|uniref:Uncharacterized protein n=1 Tax=Cytobacillus horneckiae TaxID=549687 RepID=A0A2N0ZLW1_9BACI|nr:hypothetical protein CWS20_02300 [Cytobacillus horneckiae]